MFRIKYPSCGALCCCSLRQQHLQHLQRSSIFNILSGATSSTKQHLQHLQSRLNFNVATSSTSPHSQHLQHLQQNNITQCTRRCCPPPPTLPPSHPRLQTSSMIKVDIIFLTQCTGRFGPNPTCVLDGKTESSSKHLRMYM